VALKGLSSQVSDLILASWSVGTQATYSTPINKWLSYCKDKGIEDPYKATFQQGMDFLAFLFNKGLKHSYLAVIRSALSAILPMKGGVTFGKHPDVARILKGVFRQRPSIPKSSKVITFDVGIVLNYMSSLPDNGELLLEMLTKKIVTLLCLLSGQRSQTIASLRTSFMHKCKHTGKITFAVPSLLKHSRPGKHQDPLEFVPYPHDAKICPVECLRTYLERTDLIRENSCEDSQLIISYCQPFNAVKSQTLARYVRSFLDFAGIELTFSAHSTRSASTSRANNEGLSLKDINRAAGWSDNCETFRKFYNKPLKRNFGNVILKSHSSASSYSGGPALQHAAPGVEPPGVLQAASPAVTAARAVIHDVIKPPSCATSKLWRPYIP
jgi:hypothetical protein